MNYDNEMKLIISSKSQNEAFARIAVSGFAAQLDPTIADLTDIKTAVSEAVTNAVIHGYEGMPDKNITIIMKIKNDDIYIEIIDEGRGIENIEQAKQPLFTSKPEMERSGMGFTVMETFMDSVEIISQKDKGTKIILRKRLSRQ